MSSDHWNSAYSTKNALERSCTESGDSDALAEILGCGVQLHEPVIDIGAGSSTFVYSLLRLGYLDLSVLDISHTAIDETRNRLGQSGKDVSWIVSDVLLWQPNRKYMYWNDRAVFHFLTSRQDQISYANQAVGATDSGGHIVMATFSPNGPDSCSGLPVQRWSADELAELFSESCDVVGAEEYDHFTPWGSTQSFMRLHLLRR